MAQDPVNVGAAPNDGMGDTWRASMIKLNDNDAQLFAFHAATVNIIPVTQASDIDSLAVAGVVNVTNIMVFNLLVPNIIITSRFFLDDSGPDRPRLEFTGASIFFALEYAPSVAGTFVSGSNGDFFQTNIGLVGRTAGSTLLNTDSGVIQFTGGTNRLWADLGTHQRGDFFVRNARFAGWGAGFKIKNCRSLIATEPESLLDPVGGILFDTTNNLADQQTIEISGAPGFLNPTTSLVRIDPSSRDSNRVNILGCTLAGGLLFNETGVDRAYTAVVDASTASTVINSVTNVGGLAQFNFTPGPTTFVGQQAPISGFVTNTNYNQTVQITANGAGFFRSDSIAFGSSEATGAFTLPSVTITDTATTFIEGDSVNIATDAATDYNGGSTIYNVLTNSYQINRPVTIANPQAGIASTKGLNEEDNKVLARINTNFVDSKRVACAFVNDNSTSVAGGSITNGVFRDFVFGTGGSALIECTTIQVFELIDELNGTFEVTSNEGFNGTMAYDLTAVSTGGAVEFLFKWQKDIGAGFVDLDNNLIRMVEIGGTAAAASGHVTMDLKKGDLIKPVFTRDSGASSFTARYFNCATTE